jgi:hypothetical protein
MQVKEDAKPAVVSLSKLAQSLLFLFSASNAIEVVILSKLKLDLSFYKCRIGLNSLGESLEEFKEVFFPNILT